MQPRPRRVLDSICSRIATTIMILALGACSDQSADSGAAAVPAQTGAVRQPGQPEQEDPQAALSVPGRTIYAGVKMLAIYGEPKLSASIIKRVGNGFAMTVIERTGQWIEVGVSRTGKIGFVLASDVTPWSSKSPAIVPPSDPFVRFKIVFDQLNDSVYAQTGLRFFLSARDMGDGIVNVECSTAWLSGTAEERASSLATVGKLWMAAEGSGFPIHVNAMRNGVLLQSWRGN